MDAYYLLQVRSGSFGIGYASKTQTFYFIYNIYANTLSKSGDIYMILDLNRGEQRAVHYSEMDCNDIKLQFSYSDILGMLYYQFQDTALFRDNPAVWNTFIHSYDSALHLATKKVLTHIFGTSLPSLTDSTTAKSPSKNGIFGTSVSSSPNRSAQKTLPEDSHGLR